MTNISKEQKIEEKHLAPFPTKIGTLYVEDINNPNNREEVDKVKIFDSNLHYFDYSPIDWLESNAEKENMPVDEYFNSLLKPIADAPTIEEFFSQLGTFYECCSENWINVACYIKQRYDYAINTEEELLEYERVNAIGTYYILIDEETYNRNH